MKHFDPISRRPDSGHPCNYEILGSPPGTTPQSLDLDDARSLINASLFADREGMRHLVHCTIRWDHSAEFVLRDWLHHQGRLLDKISRWLRRNAIPVSFIWVREMGRINGAHTHLLLHLPVERWGAFKEFVLSAGAFERGHDVTGEAVKLEGGDYGMKARTMRSGALRYLLKSLDPSAVARAPADIGGTRPLPAALGIRVDPDRLPITGKRCGVSYSIGEAARRDRGWTELLSVAELHAALHPRKPAP